MRFLCHTMYSLRYAVGSCSSRGVLNIIRKLRPIALNFRKDLEVASKMLKGRCSVVSDTKLLQLEDGDSSSSSLLRAVGIPLALFRIIFVILYFDCNGTTY